MYFRHVEYKRLIVTQVREGRQPSVLRYSQLCEDPVGSVALLVVDKTASSIVADSIRPRFSRNNACVECPKLFVIEYRTVAAANRVVDRENARSAEQKRIKLAQIERRLFTIRF